MFAKNLIRVMKKPAQSTLNRIFNKLLAHNRCGRYGSHNSFNIIAANEELFEKYGYQYTGANVKAMLQGKITNWKPIHFDLLELCKNYSPNNQQVTKITQK
jgi:hypothetical protein